MHDLKTLLVQAMPDLSDRKAKEQLLLHQFLAGLPSSVSRQLHATGDITELNSPVERARLLMAIDAQFEGQPAAAMAVASESSEAVKQLREQITELTEQVAALTTARGPVQPRPGVPIRRCFFCNQAGHFQRNCLSLRQALRGDNRRCFACGRQGHGGQPQFCGC